MTGGLSPPLFVYSVFSAKSNNSCVLNNKHGSSHRLTHERKMLLVSLGQGRSVARHTEDREGSADPLLMACAVGRHPSGPYGVVLRADGLGVEF